MSIVFWIIVIELVGGVSFNYDKNTWDKPSRS